MSKLGISTKIELADGRSITIETGKLAKQANGSVVVKMDKTMLLATVVTKKDANFSVDYLPLSVEYQEKYASTGRFPGGFIKRESRASDYEILIARLVDRAMRPLFPSDYHADIQIQVTLISGDKENLPDTLACLAASSAVMVSDIPFTEPVSEVRVARINGEFIVNPTVSQMSIADIDLLVAATFDNIMMVEGESKEVSEEDMVAALKVAHEAIKVQCLAQKELEKLAGKTQKIEYCHEISNPELEKKVYDATYQKVYEFASQGIADKSKRKEGFAAIKKEFIESLSEEEATDENLTLVDRYYHDVEKKGVRNVVLEKRVRLDGRKLDEIRPIWSEIDYLPSAHGSAIFTRGETQSLTTVTLGTKMDTQLIDGVINEGSMKFMLHYNFPSFSTGEVKPNRGVSRREIGHGNLAFRALKEVIPTDETINPYTVRVVSDILESNGSSSMATVCAGSLALMDAGVKISKPVSGIAMGLISDSETGKYAVLSDILGDEDHLGDMDFKVTGTRDGITACQMDIKVDGLSYEILTEALMQAKRGREHILGEMCKTISEPKQDYKSHAPRIEKLVVDAEFIGLIIGPGGKTIQEMQKVSGSSIAIDEVNGKGIVEIASDNKEALEKALKMVKQLIAKPEVGSIYDAVIKKIMPYGAFVEFLPGKEGLLHISEVDWKRLNTLEGILNEKDTVQVKLMGVDPKTGKYRLSRKELLPKPEKTEENSEEQKEQKD